MEKNTTVDTINKRLKKLYGINKYADANFRVVFSDDQTEHRWGVFRDFASKIILIREVREIREVRKYPWIKRKWILERWADGDLMKHQDLADSRAGVYVAVYVFQDANQNYLPPIWKVCEIIIRNLLNPRHRAQAMNEEIATEEKKIKEEVDAIELELKVGSDEAATKDPKSNRETASVGYTKGENDG